MSEPTAVNPDNGHASYPRAKSVSTLWVIDRDRQGSIRATLSIVPLQCRVETAAPRTTAGVMSSSGIVWHWTGFGFTKGVERFPDEARVKSIDYVTLLQSIEFDPDVNAVRVRAVVIDFNLSIVSGNKLGEGRMVQPVWLHGDRFDASKVWSLPVGENQLVERSQNMVLEMVEQIPDDSIAPLKAHDARGCRAVTTGRNRDVLVHVKQLHGIIIGEALKWQEATT